MVLDVSVHSDGACVGDSDQSNHGVDSTTGTSSVVDPGLAGSTAGQMNLLFLVYQAPKLV